jgi:hypothetical protein
MKQKFRPIVTGSLARRGSSNSVPNTNLNAVYSPEMWAMESVAILFENAVGAQLVNRDFEDDFQSFGDVVNTRRPNTAVASRKAPGDPINRQAITATNIPVKLDQHLESSFYLTDEERSKSFKNLVEEFLRPHTIALAHMLDLIVIGQYAQFMSNQAGTLGGLTNANAVEYITNGGLVLNRNKAPVVGRNIIWTPEAEALIIQNETFHEADKRGDTDGLRQASIGHKLNFDHWMDQNVPQVLQQTVVTEAISATGNSQGDTTVNVDALSADLPAGSWVELNGNVYQVAVDADATDTTFVITYGLKAAAVDDDVVNVFPNTNAIDLAAGYDAGYNKGILIDNASGAVPSDTLQEGQIVSFGAGANYTIVRIDVGATEHTIWLDRPLEADLADNDIVFYGPSGGGLNPMFTRDAITLAIRPLAPVMSGAGAISSVASFNGLTMRVTISYDHDAQAHVVTLDFLAGIKVLDLPKGGVILS